MQTRTVLQAKKCHVRTKSSLAAALLSIGALLSRTAFGATSRDACTLPDDLQREVTKGYPDAHVVSLADLRGNDKVLFVKDHGNLCPGLATVDFYGDGNRTFAIDLVSNGAKGRKASLVVAREVGQMWSLVRIDAANLGATPVVWNDKPGEYADVYGRKKVQAKRPVIVWCAYDAWAILYAWTGSNVSKIWLAD